MNGSWECEEIDHLKKKRQPTIKLGSQLKSGSKLGNYKNGGGG